MDKVTTEPGGATASPPVTAPVTSSPPVVDAPVALVDWKASLPEELRSDPALLDIADVPSLAKSMIHAQKLVGMDRSKIVTVPGEDADEATRDEFYKKVGRPEKPEDYKLALSDELKEKLEVNKDLDKWYRDTAHKHGLSAKQAESLYNEYIQWSAGFLDQSNQSLEKMRDEATAELKKEWGNAYDSKIKEAAAPLAKYADPAFTEWLDQSGMGSHPQMIRFMSKISQAMGEDTLTDASRSENVMTPSEAGARIAEKFSDKGFMEAYRKGDHPSHKWAVDEMAKLYKAQTAGT